MCPFKRHSILILQDLPLTHPVTGDENVKISVLIGLDYYWHFVQDNVVHDDGPTAVQSYLLSGPLPLPQPVQKLAFVLYSFPTPLDLQGTTQNEEWIF